VVVFLTWLLGSSFLFACFGLAGAHALGMRPRGRIGIRLAVCAFAVGGLAVAVVQSVSAGLLPWSDAGGPWLVVTLLALIGTPLVCFKRGAAGPWGSGSGPDDPGPDEPPSPRRPPGGGGIPLRDAEQSRTRVRDHGRARLGRLGARRDSREPRPTRPGVRPSR
jgi:hypothetical protein